MRKHNVKPNLTACVVCGRFRAGRISFTANPSDRRSREAGRTVFSLL
jgi:hypothetical protein